MDAYVIVLDENDNPPQFEGTPYEAVAAEDTPVGTTILPAIRITDPDLIGENIELSCIPQPQVSTAQIRQFCLSWFWAVLRKFI